MNLEIQVYEIEKAALTNMDQDEQRLFLLAGHLSNEIIILSKLLLCNSAHADNQIAEHVQFVQQLLAQRLLAGKLCEGWQMIQKFWFGTALSKTYNARLDDTAREALRDLGRYFGRPNHITSVRNRYSFHYEPNDLQAVIAGIDDGSELRMYVSGDHFNSLYYSAEAAIAKAMLREINADDPQAAFNQLFTEMLDCLRWFLAFLNNFMSVAAGIHFSKGPDNPKRDRVPIVPIGEVHMPFFIDATAVLDGDPANP